MKTRSTTKRADQTRRLSAAAPAAERLVNMMKKEPAQFFSLNERKTMKTILGGVLAAGLLVSPAFAQSASGTWNGLPDRFRIDAGYFGLTAQNVLTFNGENVDFEKDLGVNKNVNTFWVDGTWRVGRRHQLELAFTKTSQDRGDYTLTRDFTWGGQTYNAGLSASASTGADILGGYYRFAAYRNDRFEIGPTIGIGYLWLNAGIQATGTVSGPGGSHSQTLDESASSGSATGAVGGYANGWLTKRLVVRMDFLYVKVSPGSKTESVTDWRLGAEYYFFRNAGLGVQYKYNKYREAYAALSANLGGELVYKGFQVFASFLF
jgi:predicted porin